MKNLRLLALMIGVVGLIQTSNAQFGYYNDALLFSQTSFNGTARIMGIGGAQVALGGDLSSANSNPAGLGFYNRSIVSFTPGLDFHSSETDYFDITTSTFKNNFNFKQLGAVFNYSKGDIVPSKFKGGSLALSLNRINNFNNEINYDNFNPSSSIVDSYIDNSGNLVPDNLVGFAGIAYDHFLIEEADWNSDIDFFVDDANGYITPNLGDGSIEGYSSLIGRFAGSLPRQNEVLDTRGGQYQFNIAYGGNYDDRVYFGGGLGIQSVSYTQRRTYRENNFQFDDGSPDDILNEIRITDRLNIEGAGINATAGVIVRPVDFMTVGLTYTSPTYYSLNEENDYLFTTDWNSNYSYIDFGGDTTNLGFYADDSEIQVSDYSLRTPSKLNLGTAFFLGKNGFITADFEFVDYTQAQLKSNDFVVVEDNDAIKDIYQSVVNYRVGGELRFDEIRVRGGYSHQSDPFASEDQDGARKSYSFGLGYKAQDYFVDLAFVNSKYNLLYSPYNLIEDSPVAEIENQTTSVSVTVGFTF